MIDRRQRADMLGMLTLGTEGYQQQLAHGVDFSESIRNEWVSQKRLLCGDLNSCNCNKPAMAELMAEPKSVVDEGPGTSFTVLEPHELRQGTYPFSEQAHYQVASPLPRQLGPKPPLHHRRRIQLVSPNLHHLALKLRNTIPVMPGARVHLVVRRHGALPGR